MLATLLVPVRLVTAATAASEVMEEVQAAAEAAEVDSLAPAEEADSLVPVDLEVRAVFRFQGWVYRITPLSASRPRLGTGLIGLAKGV